MCITISFFISQLYSLCGKSVVSISAGKFWSAAVTATGDVYMWDGKKDKGKTPMVTRLPGVKRATTVSVGETHLLIVGSIYHPPYASDAAKNPQNRKLQAVDEVEELAEDFMFGDTDSSHVSSTAWKDDCRQMPVPSLKNLCENVAAESLVEPRNAIQMLEIANSLGADDLRKHCEDIAIHNLDYILTASSQAFASASPEIVASLENQLDLRSSESWSYRRLPTPTATFPVIINSEEEDCQCKIPRIRDNHSKKSTLKGGVDQQPDSFLQPKDDLDRSISKLVRALRKKLQQIEILEAKQANGHLLDDQQIAKLKTRSALESSLSELGILVGTSEVKASDSVSLDAKVSKKTYVSRKHKRRSKQKGAQAEMVSDFSGNEVESNCAKDLLNVEISEVSVTQEEKIMAERNVENHLAKELPISFQKEDDFNLTKGKSSSSAATKKNRKGGLSMFLSGALDDAPKDAPPPLMPKSEGPAWGGAKVSKGSASLREIQDEQSKIKVNQPMRSKDQVEDLSDSVSEGKVLLSSFLPSKPIPVATAFSSQASDAEKSTPPWASGTPPLPSRPSLRDIQMQQGKQQQSSISHSPKVRTTGFSIATGQGSPSDSPGMNRWFKPEVVMPSSIRSIQIEEKAVKDLKRFYSSVKIVKNTT
uniref:Uncharacterized protein LOC8282388 n=1 Tax=Rhizophora mucronata TaxID=61149 RepID=A0A2P2L0G2_RHIMU